MSQTNVDETAGRGQLWIRRVSGSKNKSMWDEEKTVFAPERNISYFSLSPCVDKSREDKVHFLQIQATADFHSLGNLDTEPQHDTRTRKSIKKQTGK